ncbi:MAG: hypothetical protein KDA68_02950 [Planctomycetaceae bacterium]|nr:hypothetical protein [Planctomycetaceae bacterium]
MRLWGRVVCVAAGLVSTCLCVRGEDTVREVAVGVRQLVLDDAMIESREGLVRRVHQPEKRGAVIRASNPTQTIQIRTAPVWDPEAKHYKLWVMSTDEPLRISQDGLHWVPGPKPNLKIEHAVRDPNDPDPARRYKAALLNEGFAVSPDGVNWTKLDVPLVSSQDEGNFSYDPREGLFLHMVKRSGKYGRSLALATSRDFQNWDDHGLIFEADDQDQVEGKERIGARFSNPMLKAPEYNVPEFYSVQIYNCGMFHYEGLYIGLPSVYHHTGRRPAAWEGFDKMNLSPPIRDAVTRYGDWTGFYHIQLIVSHDLKTWERVGDRAPFLEASPLGAGAYDVQTIIGPSAPVMKDDELWFYYTGIKHYALIASGNVPGFEDYRPDKGGICLAVLRRDGFVSLDAGNEAGVLLTKPLRCVGKRLCVNGVFSGDGGSLKVGVCDVAGKAIQGLEESKEILGDVKDGVVEFSGGAIESVAGREVRLRFTMRRGALYSYWWE